MENGIKFRVSTFSEWDGTKDNLYRERLCSPADLVKMGFVARAFGGGGVPSAPPAPPPPPPPPSPASPQTQVSASNASRAMAAAAGGGMAGTILTSGQGAPAPATQQQTLKQTTGG